MTSSDAAPVDFDDGVVDASNGACAGASVSFRPPTPSTSFGGPSPASISSGDSGVRREAVSALSSNDGQRPAAEVVSVQASTVADDEERKFPVYGCRYTQGYHFPESLETWKCLRTQLRSGKSLENAQSGVKVRKG